ncbi:hypothetical protein Ahy_B01g054417 [Arachis hypogaea]|uniref:Uncharacterized protein n=1 Tax=Arachis hypogaea TaxID=3818 RepID=A0A445ATU3_ARAHY|nr:hypothetical protein Ahy_B01g054417 [Arachis hypogaea]
MLGRITTKPGGKFEMSEVVVTPGGCWSRFKTYSTIQRMLEIWGNTGSQEIVEEDKREFLVLKREDDDNDDDDDDDDDDDNVNDDNEGEGVGGG